MQRLSMPLAAFARQAVNTRSALIPLTGSLSINKIYAPVHPSRLNVEIFEPVHNRQPLIKSILHLPRGKLIPILDNYPLWHSSITLPSFGMQIPPEIRADGGRNLTHRRKRIKKHWRRKHFIRDIVIYKKREKKRKLAAERVFRDRLMAKIQSAEEFDAKSYVENFLSRVDWNSATPTPVSALITDGACEEAKDEKSTQNSKRKTSNSKHWTDVISVEQLYGIPPSTYIDKTAGVADDEEWQEIVKQRLKYDDTFRKRRASQVAQKTDDNDQ